MPKTKLKRGEAVNLFEALNYCSFLNVPESFRYAITINSKRLKDEVESCRTAFPEPKAPAAYAEALEAVRKQGLSPQEQDKAEAALREEHKDAIAAHAKEREEWQKKWNAHCDEIIEVDLYKTALVPINDDVGFPQDGAERRRQNQAIINTIFPIIKDPAA